MEGPETRELTRRELVAAYLEVRRQALASEEASRLREEHDETHRRLHALREAVLAWEQLDPRAEHSFQEARELLERVKAELHVILGDPA